MANVADKMTTSEGYFEDECKMHSAWHIVIVKYILTVIAFIINSD